MRRAPQRLSNALIQGPQRPQPNVGHTPIQAATGFSYAVIASNAPGAIPLTTPRPGHDDDIAALLSLVLRSEQAAHALPAARHIIIAPAFLHALAAFLGDPCTHATGFSAFLEREAYRLPIGPLRHALAQLVSDLLWEIEQPQAS